MAPETGDWPCEPAGAAALRLRVPDAFDPISVSEKKGVYTCSAALEPAALQDLVDALPDIVRTAAGVPLEFRVEVTLGEGKDVAADTVESLNGLLKDVSPDLGLKP